MSQFIYQQQQAWASLKKKPGFVASVVTTMSFTMGALLCVLTLAYVLLSKPLPYPEQDSLYTVEHNLIDNNGKIDGTAYTYPNLMHLYKNQKAFSLSALLYIDGDVLLSQPTHPKMQLSFITPEWFSLLNAKMAVGRTFEQSEALDTYNPVAVLSYNTWLNEFSLAKDILSKKVNFSGVSYQIIGVLSEEFTEPLLYGPGLKTAVFLPWDYNSVSERDRKAWGNDDSGLLYLAKLPSASTSNSSSKRSPKQLEQTLTTLINNNWQENVAGREFFTNWGIGIKVHTLKSVILNGSEKTVYLLLAGVVGLVLIACANIANLFMSRTAEQQRQLAIHAALGASKKHLFKTLLAETGLLMFISIVIALMVASGCFLILQHFLANYLPRVDELSINTFTLSSAIVLVIALALFFARLSTNMINYHALNATLQSSGKGTGIQVSKNIRKGLITSQVAIVTALVFINIVLFKDAITTINEPTGFETDNISWLVLSLPSNKELNRESKIADVAKVRSQLLALPQVEMISQSRAPMAFSTLAATVFGTNERFSVKAKDVDHQYFQLINQPLIEGNYFSEADIKDDNNILIINDVFAKQLAPNGSALGIKFKSGARVIGVVKGIKIPDTSEIPARFYYPSSPSRNMMLVKVKAGQTLLRQQILNTLQHVNKQFKLFSLTTLNERRNSRLFTQYTTFVTSGLLAIITLFLAAVGLYGILSYSTQMRRFELGTRMAIGAKRKDLIMLIIKDNAKSLILGLAISVLLLLALYLSFSEYLISYINVQLVPVCLFTLLLIGIISISACYLPLRPFINKPAINSLKGSD